MDSDLRNFLRNKINKRNQFQMKIEFCSNCFNWVSFRKRRKEMKQTKEVEVSKYRWVDSYYIHSIYSRLKSLETFALLRLITRFFTQIRRKRRRRLVKTNYIHICQAGPRELIEITFLPFIILLVSIS